MNWKLSSLAIVPFLAGLSFLASVVGAQQDPVRGTPAEPADAAEVREQIATVQKLMPSLPDRGAALYVLAVSKQHLHETLEALALLKECVSLQEGFDPSGDPEFRGLKGDKEFNTLVERVHRNFPAVMKARNAMVTEEKDLVPEGLAYDERQNVFYMGSLNRRKIVKITPDSQVSDFVPADRYKLLQVLGIRLDPRDGSVWAATTDFVAGASATELIHLDARGNLLCLAALPQRAASSSAADPSAAAGGAQANDSEPVPAFHAEAPKGPLPPTMDPNLFDQIVVKNAYIFAGRIKKVLYQQPCYCHCDQSQGHGSLLDCFVSKHGAGCGTCLLEDLYAYEQSRKGRTAAQIREGIEQGDWRYVDASKYEKPLPPSTASTR